MTDICTVKVGRPGASKREHVPFPDFPSSSSICCFHHRGTLRRHRISGLLEIAVTQYTVVFLIVHQPYSLGGPKIFVSGHLEDWLTMAMRGVIAPLKHEMDDPGLSKKPRRSADDGRQRVNDQRTVRTKVSNGHLQASA